METKIIDHEINGHAVREIVTTHEGFESRAFFVGPTEHSNAFWIGASRWSGNSWTYAIGDGGLSPDQKAAWFDVADALMAGLSANGK